jgi:hypothetical protein
LMKFTLSFLFWTHFMDNSIIAAKLMQIRGYVYSVLLDFSDKSIIHETKVASRSQSSFEDYNKCSIYGFTVTGRPALHPTGRPLLYATDVFAPLTQPPSPFAESAAESVFFLFSDSPCRIDCSACDGCDGCDDADGAANNNLQPSQGGGVTVPTFSSRPSLGGRRGRQVGSCEGRV